MALVYCRYLYSQYAFFFTISGLIILPVHVSQAFSVNNYTGIILWWYRCLKVLYTRSLFNAMFGGVGVSGQRVLIISIAATHRVCVHVYLRAL